MSLDDALLRGRDAIVASTIATRGIPANAERWRQFHAHREGMKRRLIRASPFAFLFDDLVRKENCWGDYLEAEGLLAMWTKTPKSQKPSTQLNVLTENAKVHPQLEPLLELQNKLDLLDDSAIAVGDDGRNRSEKLLPYTTVTGRYTWNNGQVFVSKDHVLRGFVQPPPGGAIGDIDYCRQEWWVGACLSGDEKMKAVAGSEDVYVELARRVGQWPEGATKESAKAVRDRFKGVAFAINYGAGPRRLSIEAGIPLREAEKLHAAIRAELPVFFAWVDNVVVTAQLEGRITSPLGFSMHVVDEPGFTTKPTTLLDFKMQSAGADMTRAAARLAIEEGLPVCFLHHDSLMVDAPESEVKDMVARTQTVMRKAAVEVIGTDIPTEARIVHHPDTLLEPEDEERWAELMELLDAEIAEPSEPPAKPKRTRKRKATTTELPLDDEPSMNDPLLFQHLKKLEESGVSDNVSQARGYRSVIDRDELSALGFVSMLSPVPGLLIPLHGVDGLVVGYQYRPDEPYVDQQGKTQKYVNPRGQQMVLDIPVGAWEHLDDPAVPLVVTEGPIKADGAVSKGLCCVALLGVRCWTGTNTKGGKTVLVEWRSVALNGRQVTVVYDSDVSEKDEVRDALVELAAFLITKGAKPQVARRDDG